jgi:hypothetical protein
MPDPYTTFFGPDRGVAPARCGHRSPLNYDHTRWASCALSAGHDGDHRQGDLAWRTGFMPCRSESAANALEGSDARG